MCFMLYMAAACPLPELPWNSTDPRLNTSDPGDSGPDLERHLSLPFRTCVGSSQHCGCGFRHAMYQNGDWPEIEFRDPDPDDAADEQANHNQLAQLLEKLLESCEAIELYGCWNGELTAPRAGQQKISADELRAPHFVFRERFKYIVTRD